MRHQDLNEIRRAVRRFCREHGLVFREIHPRRGTHGAWLVSTPEGELVFKDTIPLARKELSPGVQRQLLKHAEQNAEKEPQADLKLSIKLEIRLRELREWFAEFLRDLFRG